MLIILLPATINEEQNLYTVNNDCRISISTMISSDSLIDEL